MKLPDFSELRRVLLEETHGINPRLHALNLGGVLLPRHGAGAARAGLMRLAGVKIGERTTVESVPRMNGDGNFLVRLTIGADCEIDHDCSFELQDEIRIGDQVMVGPESMILTSSHELASRMHRAGPLIRKPVAIEEGARLGARSIVLPGVTVGAGAIVNPGAVVTKDVLPRTRVGGIPAIQLEVLDEEAGA